MSGVYNGMMVYCADYTCFEIPYKNSFLLILFYSIATEDEVMVFQWHHIIAILFTPILNK